MKLVSLFERENSLGLVFAEDRYSVGWNGNRAFAERLAAELSPCSKLPAFPTFPKGTMFWCRPAALAPLWQRGFLSADFPPEPLPDDGSILHAIERMLPAITESVGLSWCTLYRRSAWW